MMCGAAESTEWDYPAQSFVPCSAQDERAHEPAASSDFASAVSVDAGTFLVRLRATIWGLHALRL